VIPSEPKMEAIGLRASHDRHSGGDQGRGGMFKRGTREAAALAETQVGDKQRMERGVSSNYL
jgi:hypothetical protein